MKCGCGKEMQWVGSLREGKLECIYCAVTQAFADAMTKEDPDLLPEGLKESGGVIYATCRVCEQDYELPCDIEEFNLEYSYCGGSPRCCP